MVTLHCGPKASKGKCAKNWDGDGWSCGCECRDCEDARILKEAKEKITKRKQKEQNIQRQVESNTSEVDEQTNALFQQAQIIQGKSESEIEALIAQGTVSLGIWRQLYARTCASQQRILQIDQEEMSTASELHQVEQQIQDLRAKKQLLQTKLVQLAHEKKKIPVQPKEVQILSEIEDRVDANFKSRLMDSNWVVADILPVEISLVLNSCKLLSIRDSITKANIPLGDLEMIIDARSYDTHKIKGNYLEFRRLELLWDLLQAHQYPPGDHLKECPVCSVNRDELVKEWKLSMDFSAYPPITASELLYVPTSDLSSIFKLAPRDFSTKFKAMKRVHDDFISAKKP